MKNTYSPITVKIFGGVGPEGEEIKRARVDLCGSSDGCSATLYVYDSETKWLRPRDHLADCKVTENDKTLSLVGRSSELMDQVELAPSEAEARWELQLATEGCARC